MHMQPCIGSTDAASDCSHQPSIQTPCPPPFQGAPTFDWYQWRSLTNTPLAALYDSCPVSCFSAPAEQRTPVEAVQPGTTLQRMHSTGIGRGAAQACCSRRPLPAGSIQQPQGTAAALTGGRLAQLGRHAAQLHHLGSKMWLLALPIWIVLCRSGVRGRTGRQRKVVSILWPQALLRRARWTAAP